MEENQEMNRNNRSQENFNQGYARLIIYRRDRGSFDLDQDYVTKDGFPLGQWLFDIRKLWEEGKLLKSQEDKLIRIGISKKETDQNWESLFLLAKEYYMQHEDMNISVSYRTADGALLGAWVDRQRRYGRLLSSMQKEKLLSIGVDV